MNARSATTFLVAVLLLVTAWSASAAPATQAASLTTQAGQRQVVGDVWFRVYIGNSLVGWARTLSTDQPAASGALEEAMRETRFEFHLTLERGGFNMKADIVSTFVETGTGRPVRSIVTKKMGENEVEEQMYFRGERGERGVDFFTRQLGRLRHDVLPGVVNAEARAAGGGSWVAAREAEQIVLDAMKRGEQRIAVWTLDPSAGAQVIRTITTRDGEAVVEVAGEKINTTVWRQEIEGRPGPVMKMFVDRDFNAVQLEQTIPPGMTIRLVRSDESAAGAKADRLEVMASSFIKAGATIPDARRLRRGVFELDASGADGKNQERQKNEVVAVTAANQRATPSQADGRAGSRFRIEVDLDKPVWISPGDPDWPTDEHRKSSAMLDFEDEKVAALVKRAAANVGGASAGEKARSLRTFVHRHIHRKDYTIAFATASEVARTQRGDCTEHGVLLAAMLRGAGVPSRVVTGLIYAPFAEGQRDVFVYHMWAQAWIEEAGEGGKRRGRWMDVDATLPDGELFDAAHVALGVASLSATSPIADDLAYRLAALGNVTLRVIEPVK